jgi:hypothetical protein
MRVVYYLIRSVKTGASHSPLITSSHRLRSFLLLPTPDTLCSTKELSCASTTCSRPLLCRIMYGSFSAHGKRQPLAPPHYYLLSR